MIEEFKLTTPVVFMVFNRLDTTKKVFEKICEAKPSVLFIISDGYRIKKRGGGERLKVRKVREFIETNINWKCQVYKNYADKNMGSRNRTSSGLDWVFENTEEAIILEDDCLPDISFFRYCQELLQLYKYDTRINMISGSNLIENYYDIKNSYVFSSFTPIWGWATWKRAWNKYDVNINQWPEMKKKKMLLPVFGSYDIYKYYMKIFDEIRRYKIDAWDYQWFFTQIMNSGLSIIPAKNMIKNIGIGHKDATHTKKHSKYESLKANNIEFPLKIEKNVLRNYYYDDILLRYVSNLQKKRLSNIKLIFYMFLS